MYKDHRPLSSAIAAMSATYGFPVFPESWDGQGQPWGDQWYNWDGVVNLLVLERLVAWMSPTQKYMVSAQMQRGSMRTGIEMSCGFSQKRCP